MTFKHRLRGHLIDAYLSPRAQRIEQRLRSRRRPNAPQLYFDAADPYSYLLAQLVPALQDRYDVAVGIQPVSPPRSDVDPAPRDRQAHAVRDAIELSQYYQLDFPKAARPADPMRAERAGAILVSAPLRERPQVAVTVGAAVWQEDDATLDAAAARWGASPDAKKQLDDGYAALRRAGHYQGGMIEIAGDWAWGIDRLHYVEAHLRAASASVRATALRNTDRIPADRDSVLSLRAEEDWPKAPTLREPLPPLELYFSFRSPYSYLALDRTRAMAQRLGVKLHIKPVLPMVMRGLPVPRDKRLYIVKDSKREADRLGIPFGKLCDPVGPGAERCLAVFGAAPEHGRDAEFCSSAARGIWSEALDMASDDDLRLVTERAGVPWPGARSALQSDAWRSLAETNRRDLSALGLWGVPSFRFGDYATWGQDRLWMVEHRIASATRPP